LGANEPLSSGLVTDKMAIQEIIYSFYRDLMGANEPKLLRTHPRLWTGQSCVSDFENEELRRSFTPEELDVVLKETKTDTAPGPDGFPVMFYKKFWPMLRRPVLRILNGFAMGTVDIARLNFGILSLIPKVTRAVDIKQFRPITLINVIFKLVSKAYAIRLSPVAHRTISLAQTTFIKGIFIQDGPWLCMRLFMNSSLKDFQRCSSNWILRKHMIESAGIFSARYCFERASNQ
jgi:hypothetical protein